MTTQDDIVKSVRGSFGGGPFTATHQDRAENNIRLHEVILFVKDAVDAMPGDATAETAAYWYVPAHMVDGVEVVSVTVLPKSALTAHDTNNASILIDKTDGAGGARTNVATLTTNLASGNWVAFARKSATVTSTLADRTVAAGGAFTFEITKANSGVAVGICTIVMVVKEL